MGTKKLDRINQEAQRDLLSVAVLELTIDTKVKHTRTEALIETMRLAFADKPHVLAKVDQIEKNLKTSNLERLGAQAS